MGRTLRTGWSVLAGLTAALLLGGPAMAEDFPSRTITLIDPFTPGGNVDTTARIVAAQLERVIGRTVIVVNKPGAAGVLGAEYVKRANPDGYTLLVGSNGPLSSAPVFHKPKYDVQKDFTSIGLVSWTPESLIVGKDVPAKSVAEFLAYGTGRQLRAASGGIDSAPGIAMAEFNLLAKLTLVEPVYQGASEFYPALMGGHVELAFDTINTAGAMARSGNIRVLAVASETRSPLAPDVPTLKECGLDAVEGAFVGLVAPSGTPAPIVATLRAAFAKAMSDPETVSKLRTLGSVVGETSAAAMDEYIRSETERARTVQAARASAAAPQ